MIRDIRLLLMFIVPTLVVFAMFEGFNLASKSREADSELKRFEIAADRAEGIIARKISHIALSLEDIASVLEIAEKSQSSMSQAFHSFVRRSHLFEEFPAIRGVGVIVDAKYSRLDDVIRNTNNDPERASFGYPPFIIQGLADTDDHAFITLFEPLSKGALAEIGRDIFSRERHETYLTAMKTQQTSLSGFFELRDNIPVVAMLVPYFKSDSAAKTPIGAITTIFRIDLFLDGLNQEISPLGVDVSVVDLGALSAGTEKEVLLATTAAPNGADKLSDSINTIRNVHFGGRQWQLRVVSSQPIGTLWALDAHFLMSVVISFLSGSLIYKMSRNASVLSSQVKMRTKSLKLAAASLEREKIHAYEAATHDALTGLLNERGLTRAYEQHFKSERGDQDLSILSIDLDRFKEINDTTSYSTGNQLIIFVAEFLNRIMPAGSFLARFGGDEYIILTPINCDQARELAADIVCWANQPQTVDGRVIRFGASIGIAANSTVTGDLLGLLSHANIALSSAKSAGRGRSCLYDDEIKRKTVQTKLIADELRRAIEEDEFEAYFQTQHCAKDFSISGVECLIRWNHPKRGILPPAAFLDVAETIGILSEIDAIALRKSAAGIAELERSGIFVPKLSVNLSLERLRDPELLFALDNLPEIACELTFEILETVFIDQIEKPIRELLAELTRRGISIEIDDFGSGRASILGLTQLDPARLKIDRALVMPLLERTSQRALLQSIVSMGNALQIGVTAEGVETNEHAQILREIGVDTLQGYYFSKPMPLSDLKKAFLLRAA